MSTAAQGILYGVGVGPGDPALLTLRAVELLRYCDVVAAPSAGKDTTTALSIVEGYTAGKEVLLCPTPMTRDETALEQAACQSADLICARLDAGQTVCFITLGDPSIYSTYAYIHRRVHARGYTVQMVPGVPSFCAVAAALNTPLCEGGQMLHIIPASYDGADMGLDLPGAKVLMKSGRQLSAVSDQLKARGLLSNAKLGARVSMPGQLLCHDLSNPANAPDYDAVGYFATIIITEDEDTHEHR